MGLLAEKRYPILHRIIKGIFDSRRDREPWWQPMCSPWHAGVIGHETADNWVNVPIFWASLMWKGWWIDRGRWDRSEMWPSPAYNGHWFSRAACAGLWSIYILSPEPVDTFPGYHIENIQSGLEPARVSITSPLNHVVVSDLGFLHYVLVMFDSQEFLAQSNNLSSW